MTVIEVEGLVHVYAEGAVRALDGVNLSIGPGERVAIVGQNGSGKTTLVRHFNGLLRPTQGRVLVGDSDARELTVARLAREVGLVFQDPDRQIFASSVRAEVEFGARNVGIRGDGRRAAVRAALEAVGLADEEDTNPYDLGQSRRKLLALASVLAMGTPVLVLDEPTTGQDERGSAIVRAVIDAVAGEGQTVIAITHDMRFVADSFARVVVMRSGRVVLDGPPEVVFAPGAWPVLASTRLEPTLAARLGDRLGLGVTPSDAAFVDAVAARRS
jgi:energy-coupling factor transport system ATP-binding protein